ncbi:hypothetical protein [Hymenobacter fastidiosus]
MPYFVINSGSSSLKHQLFRGPQEQPLKPGVTFAAASDTFR